MCALFYDILQQDEMTSCRVLQESYRTLCRGQTHSHIQPHSVSEPPNYSSSKIRSGKITNRNSAQCAHHQNPQLKTTRPARMMLKSTLQSFRGDNLEATPFSQAAREA
ncbi:uncharacterized protein MEPE_04351 [Melanopsichium pennsylvanicum]|uniref:Uncharacterized protein n=1 Tax=Melanopsichium pennsylvanicum TaxID=63383 RepID=A0AAJ4XNU8_9BASI|nr:uncharacterized protein MEPE_04351 [Melanopsichium pennsylvanicum]